MNKKKLLIALICFFIAIGLAISQYFYFNKQFKTSEVEVLISKEDITSGAELIEGVNAEKIIIPSKVALKDIMLSSLQGKKVFAKIDIPKGCYITVNMLSLKKLPLPEGSQRKITIKVDLYSAIAGKISPGDVVDIGFTPNKESTDPAGTIANKLIILDVTDEKGNNTKSNNSKNAYKDVQNIPSAVTLLVNDNAQASMLKYKEKKGNLYLVGY